MTEATTRTDTDILDQFQHEGWKLVKVDPETKGGIDAEWQKRSVSLAALRNHLQRGGGVGVQVGEVSNWLNAADADHEFAIATAPAFLPETLSQAKGREISHYLVYCEGLGYEQFNDLSGNRLIDIKASNNGAGHLVVVEPTQHPDKGPYRFIGGFNPAAIAHVPRAEFRRSVQLWACAALIAAHLPKTREEGEGGRHDLSNALAGFALRNGWTEEEALKVLREAWKARKAPEKALKNLERNVSDTAWKVARGEPATGGRTLEELVPGLAGRIAKFMGWERVDRRERLTYNLTDMGNAERFVDQHGHKIRYCYEWASWLVFDGTRWVRDVGGGRARRLAKQTVRSMYAEAADTPDDTARKAIAKHAAASEAASKIEAMLKLAECEAPITPDKLDSDPYLLNVLNGTVDLRTGDLREHRQEDFLTKLAPVEFDPRATAPTWAAFLERVLPSEALRRFVQRAVGYSLLGETCEEVLFFLYGTGANGKSTFINTILEALGDYARQAPPELLTVKGYTHPTELARLKGARFVASVEVEEGRRLAESLVKQLTGRDPISARFMRQDFFDFEPTHTVFLAANHKPVVRGTDLAIWRRIKLVPFTVTIPEDERDPGLQKALGAELPGVFAWAVRGCLDYLANGLGESDEVRAATQEYRDEMDVLQAFLNDRCVVHPEAWCAATPLYNSYKAWCEESGETPETQRRFGARLAERGYESFTISSGAWKARKGWRGIGLLSPPDGGNDGDKGPPPDGGGGPPGGKGVDKVDNHQPGQKPILITETDNPVEGVDDGRPKSDIDSSEHARVAVMPELGQLGQLGQPEPSNGGRQRRRLTAEQAQRVQRLMDQGMSATWARREVLGEEG